MMQFLHSHDLTIKGILSMASYTVHKLGVTGIVTPVLHTHIPTKIMGCSYTPSLRLTAFKWLTNSLRTWVALKNWLGKHAPSPCSEMLGIICDLTRCRIKSGLYWRTVCCLCNCSYFKYPWLWNIQPLSAWRRSCNSAWNLLMTELWSMTKFEHW